MNKNITLRYLSTEKAFSENLGPHVSIENPGPRAHCAHQGHKCKNFLGVKFFILYDKVGPDLFPKNRSVVAKTRPLQRTPPKKFSIALSRQKICAVRKGAKINQFSRAVSGVLNSCVEGTPFMGHTDTLRRKSVFRVSGLMPHPLLGKILNFNEPKGWFSYSRYCR